MRCQWFYYLFLAIFLRSWVLMFYCFGLLVDDFLLTQRRRGVESYFVCLQDSSSLSSSGYHILNEMSMVLLPFFGDVFKVLGVNVLLFWFIG